jgi:hypothetical protein
MQEKRHCATLYDAIARIQQLPPPDPRISTAINAEFGRTATIVNIGAGVGSYEPRDRKLVAARRLSKRYYYEK